MAFDAFSFIGLNSEFLTHASTNVPATIPEMLRDRKFRQEKIC